MNRKIAIGVCILWACLTLCQCLPTSFIHYGHNRRYSDRTKRGLLSTLGLTGGGISGGTASGLSSAATILANSIKDTDDDESSQANKPKPYHFNDMELTAIQAIVSLRDIIGELLHRVGVNIPSSLASLITRSESAGASGTEKASFLSSDSASSSLSGGPGMSTARVNNMALLMRGLALSLPLLIPMATQLRRMSTDSLVAPIQLPQLPLMPDPYYDQALHRRRGKRSTVAAIAAARLEHNLRRLKNLYEGQSRE